MLAHGIKPCATMLHWAATTVPQDPQQVLSKHKNQRLVQQCQTCVYSARSLLVLAYRYKGLSYMAGNGP